MVAGSRLLRVVLLLLCMLLLLLLLLGQTMLLQT
jgi:hypothetical protein